MDVLGSANVYATGGLSRKNHLGIAVELSGHDDLLNVPARQAARRGRQRRRLHCEVINESLAMFLDGLEVEESTTTKTFLAVVYEQ